MASASDFVVGGSILSTRDQHRAELGLDRRADLAFLQRESDIGHFRVDHACLRHGAEIDVLRFEAAFGGDVGKSGAALDAVGGGLRVRQLRKHDLLDVALLRRDEARMLLVIGLLDVVVGNLHPLRQRRGRHRDGVDLAVFRRPEQDFTLVEIFAQLLVGRLRDVAGLRRAERHILDAALLILELIDGVEPGLRQRDVAGYAVDELPAQRSLSLGGEKAFLGHAHVVQEHFEPRAVELTVLILQLRIGRDVAGYLGVGEAEPHLLRELVEPGLGDHFTEHLAVEADRVCLVRRQRMSELAADLLQAVVVGLPELGGLRFQSCRSSPECLGRNREKCR